MKRSAKNYWIARIDKVKCSLCEMCTNRCPTKALFLIKNKKEEKIEFDYKLCNNCGGKPYCQEHCPELAIKIVKAKSTKNIKIPLILVKGELSKCADCDTLFVPIKKIAAIRNKGVVKKKEIQKLCPDCRRKKLLVSAYG